jgi:hypothetical protein
VVLRSQDEIALRAISDAHAEHELIRLLLDQRLDEIAGRLVVLGLRLAADERPLAEIAG